MKSLKDIEEQIFSDFYSKVDEIESPFDSICNICLFENEPPPSQCSQQNQSNKTEQKLKDTSFHEQELL